jgi:hypothetical protein
MSNIEKGFGVPQEKTPEKESSHYELPSKLKEEAGQALGYLKELVDEFPDTKELQDHLDWLINKSNELGAGLNVETLQTTQLREKEKEANFPTVTPLHSFTQEIERLSRHSELDQPGYRELQDLLHVLRTALDTRKYRLDPHYYEDQR